MTDQQRLLILTADAGFGHRSAANAIAQAMAIKYGKDSDCQIINPVLERRSPFILRNTMLNYDRTVRNSTAFYRFTYRISDLSVTSRLLEAAMILLQAGLMKNLIEEYHPDGVVSTYHLYHSAMVAAIKSLMLSTPFFTVTTDLQHLHKLWFRPVPTLFFASSEKVGQEALENGIPDKKVIYSGIPVNPALADRSKSKDEIRRNLDWDPDLPVVLMVGSKRVENILSCALAVDEHGLPIQMIIIAGGDDQLYADLGRHPFQTPHTLYNYVKDLSPMFLASDVLISKAGGLILSEGLAAGLPMILIDAIPGQESGNVEQVCSHGAAVVAQSPQQLVDILENWMVHQPDARNRTAQNSQALGKPDAAFTIAEKIWQTL